MYALEAWAAVCSAWLLAARDTTTTTTRPTPERADGFARRAAGSGHGLVWALGLNCASLLLLTPLHWGPAQGCMRTCVCWVGEVGREQARPT